MLIEQLHQCLWTIQVYAEGHGLFQPLWPPYSEGDHGCPLEHEKLGMGILDQHSQLIEDQTRLEFQCGGQGLGDLQQCRLLAGVQFDPRMEQAFCRAREEYAVSGRHIFNATVGGKLEVFPRVDYNSLF